MMTFENLVNAFKSGASWKEYDENGNYLKLKYKNGYWVLKHYTLIGVVEKFVRGKKKRKMKPTYTKEVRIIQESEALELIARCYTELETWEKASKELSQFMHEVSTDTED